MRSIIPLDGQQVLLTRDQIAEFSAMPGSLMPEGLHATLAIEEFRDLVAFLESLK